MRASPMATGQWAQSGSMCERFDMLESNRLRSRQACPAGYRPVGEETMQKGLPQGKGVDACSPVFVTSSSGYGVTKDTQRVPGMPSDFIGSLHPSFGVHGSAHPDTNAYRSQNPGNVGPFPGSVRSPPTSLTSPGSARACNGGSTPAVDTPAVLALGVAAVSAGWCMGSGGPAPYRPSPGDCRRRSTGTEGAPGGANAAAGQLRACGLQSMGQANCLSLGCAPNEMPQGLQQLAHLHAQRMALGDLHPQQQQERVLLPAPQTIRDPLQRQAVSQHAASAWLKPADDASAALQGLHVMSTSPPRRSGERDLLSPRLQAASPSYSRGFMVGAARASALRSQLSPGRSSIVPSLVSQLGLLAPASQPTSDVQHKPPTPPQQQQQLRQQQQYMCTDGEAAVSAFSPRAHVQQQPLLQQHSRPQLARPTQDAHAAGDGGGGALQSRSSGSSALGRHAESMQASLLPTQSLDWPAQQQSASWQLSIGMSSSPQQSQLSQQVGQAQQPMHLTQVAQRQQPCPQAQYLTNVSGWPMQQQTQQQQRLGAGGESQQQAPHVQQHGQQHAEQRTVQGHAPQGLQQWQTNCTAAWQTPSTAQPKSQKLHSGSAQGLHGASYAAQDSGHRQVLVATARVVQSERQPPGTVPAPQQAAAATFASSRPPHCMPPPSAQQMFPAGPPSAVHEVSGAESLGPTQQQGPQQQQPSYAVQVPVGHGWSQNGASGLSHAAVGPHGTYQQSGLQEQHHRHHQQRSQQQQNQQLLPLRLQEQQALACALGPTQHEQPPPQQQYDSQHLLSYSEAQQNQLSGQDSCATPDGSAQEEVEGGAQGGPARAVLQHAYEAHAVQQDGAACAQHHAPQLLSQPPPQHHNHCYKQQQQPHSHHYQQLQQHHSLHHQQQHQHTLQQPQQPQQHNQYQQHQYNQQPVPQQQQSNHLQHQPSHYSQQPYQQPQQQQQQQRLPAQAGTRAGYHDCDAVTYQHLVVMEYQKQLQAQRRTSCSSRSAPEPSLLGQQLLPLFKPQEQQPPQQQPQQQQQPSIVNTIANLLAGGRQQSGTVGGVNVAAQGSTQVHPSIQALQSQQEEEQRRQQQRQHHQQQQASQLSLPGQTQPSIGAFSSADAPHATGQANWLQQLLQPQQHQQQQPLNPQQLLLLAAAVGPQSFPAHARNWQLQPQAQMAASLGQRASDGVGSLQSGTCNVRQVSLQQASAEFQAARSGGNADGVASWQQLQWQQQQQEEQRAALLRQQQQREQQQALVLQQQQAELQRKEREQQQQREQQHAILLQQQQAEQQRKEREKQQQREQQHAILLQQQQAEQQRKEREKQQQREKQQAILLQQQQAEQQRKEREQQQALLLQQQEQWKELQLQHQEAIVQRYRQQQLQPCAGSAPAATAAPAPADPAPTAAVGGQADDAVAQPPPPKRCRLSTEPSAASPPAAAAAAAAAPVTEVPPDGGAAAAAAAIKAVDELLASWRMQQAAGMDAAVLSALAGSGTAAVAPQQRQRSQLGKRTSQGISAAAAAVASGPVSRQSTPEPSADEPQQGGCARACAIDFSKVGRHRNKPLPVILPIRPGHRSVQGPQSTAAAAAGSSGAAPALENGGAAGPRRRTAKRNRVSAAELPPPVGMAVGSTAGGVRLTRNGPGGRGDGAQQLNALREAKALMKYRFVVRRSTIAQQGVFVTTHVPADTLLMEYHGEAVRSSVANLREKRYGAAGLGCYLFNPGAAPDEAVVLDATYRGNIMRFVNHSCEPNCDSRSVVIDGQRRIFLYSLTELSPGTELTYDYKLSSELCLDLFKGLPEEMLEKAARDLGTELMRCCCGSRKCRKYL